MKQDKYLGYWQIKGTKNFIKVISGSVYPRWRIVKRINRGLNGYYENSCSETVDYLRINCEKVTEDTVKEYTKGKI